MKRIGVLLIVGGLVFAIPTVNMGYAWVALPGFLTAGGGVYVLVLGIRSTRRRNAELDRLGLQRPKQYTSTGFDPRLGVVGNILVVVVAVVVIMVPVLLVLGNRTGTFPTFPFAGFTAALIIGAVIVWAATKGKGR